METGSPIAPDPEHLLDERRRLEERLAAGSLTPPELLDLGSLCETLGDRAAALRHFGASAAMAPDWRLPILRIADILRATGRQREAVVAYGRALELEPKDAETHLKLGNLLSDTRDYGQAIEHYERASDARPDWYLPHLNRGNALAAAGDLDAAREAYDRALAIGGPAGIRIRRDLLLPIVPTGADEYAAAHDRYANALSALLADPPRLGDPLAETPASKFYLAYHGKDDRSLQQDLARVYLAGCPTLRWTAPHCAGGPRRPGPRRVAFISRFLFDHSVGRLCLGLLRRLAAHDDCELLSFETALVADDPVRAEVRRLAARTEMLPTALPAAREQVAAAEPDIVFYPEIGMDPVAYFLAFARLAPVQCVTWGHPMTTGIPAIDYFLSCDAAEPEDAGPCYSERLVRLDGLPFSYARPPRPAPPKQRADFGLDESTTLYFLAQNLFKIHPEMDSALAGVLRADPDGVILLLEGHDPRWGEVLRRRFHTSFGADAGRVVFLPRQSHDDYLRLLALANVSLDSFPFCGGNTTYQALAMGTPVVTLPGAYLRGRLSLAIYDRMGVTDCVARDPEDYARIAVRLGTEPAFATSVRRRIADRRGRIFDDPVFLEEAERFLMTATPPVD